MVVRKASLFKGKVYGSISKPIIVYRSKQVLTPCDCCSSFQTAMLYYNLLDSNTIQPFAHSFKASACCYTSFSLITTVNQRSGRESMCTPLFHLGKSQSTCCTHCSDLDCLVCAIDDAEQPIPTRCLTIDSVGDHHAAVSL